MIKKKKHAGGRPRKYLFSELPALGEKMVEYFEEYLTTLETKKEVPFLETWGRTVDISDDTIVNYSKQNKEYLAAYKKCKQIQKEVLIQGGLKGFFNPTAFIFTAKNITDMRDKTETDITSKGDKIETSVNVQIEKVYGKPSDSTDDTDGS